MTEIRLPTLGQSATEAVLVEWTVKPGDAVKVGDVVAVVETDKTDVEVVAPADGILGPHQADPGQTYAAGTVLAEVFVDVAQHQARANVQKARVTPKARRLAAERGIDIGALTGSGADGMVVAEDVPAGTDPHVRERRRMTPAQRAGARRTTESWRSAPHFVQFIDVDVTDLAAARDGITWTAFFVSALAHSLAEHPHLNATVGGDDVVLFEDINVGVAVDTPGGLLVPVIARADQRSPEDLAEAIARIGETGHGDIQPSTATVSNLGAFGVTAGTPVLNPPEAVLLFAGAVEHRVVVRDGEPVVRTMCTLSIAFDHRVADGATAARFTAEVRDQLEAGR